MPTTDTTTPVIRDSTTADLEPWDDLAEATGAAMAVSGAELWSDGGGVRSRSVAGDRRPVSVDA